MTQNEMLNNFQSVVMGNKMNDRLAASIEQEKRRLEMIRKNSVKLRKCPSCGGSYYMGSSEPMCKICAQHEEDRMRKAMGILKQLQPLAPQSPPPYTSTMDYFTPETTTTDPKPDQPLSCPCCGGDATSEKMGSFFVYIKCSGCGLKTDNFEKPEEALACWNKRQTTTNQNLSIREASLLREMAGQNMTVNDLIALQNRAQKVERMLGDGLKDMASTISNNKELFNAKPGDKVINVASRLLREYAADMASRTNSKKGDDGSGASL